MNNLPLNEQAEALDVYLDKLRDFSGTSAPEKLSPDMASIARLVGQRPPTLNPAIRERIWTKAVQNAHRPRRLSLAGAFPVGLAAIIAIFLVFVALYRPTQQSVAGATATPAPASFVRPWFIFEGVIEQTAEGITFQTHAWYQSPDHFRYEDYMSRLGSNSDLATQVSQPDSATAVKIAAQSTAVAGANGSAPTLFEIEVNDGQRHWLYDATQNAVYEPHPGETAWINRFNTIPTWYPGPGPYDDNAAELKAVIALLQQSYASATLQERVPFLNRPAWLIEVRPPSDRFDNPNTAPQTVKRLLWIDQQTYLQLNMEDYDSAGNLLLRYGFTSLNVNPTFAPFDPSVFRLNLPESSWQNPSWKQIVDETAFDWHVAAASAPFPAYRPTSIMLSNFDIFVGSATYNPFTHLLTQQGYASKDPYGPAILQIYEMALSSNMPSRANAQTVPLGSPTRFIGTMWQQDGVTYLAFPSYTTSIILASTSLYPQQLEAIAASFTYAAPYLGSTDLDSLWKGISSRVAYPLYVINHYDDSQGIVSRATGGKYGVLPDKLALGEPSFNGDAVTQPLYYSDRADIAGLIIEMPAARLVVPGNATAQPIGSFTGYYHEDDQYRYLDVLIGQTAITLKMRKDVPQDTLITLGSSLQALAK